MIGALINKIFGSHHDRTLKKLWPIVDEINEWYEKLNALSDEQLQAKTWEFRERLQDGETLNDLLPEAYAVVKQACKRHVGKSWLRAGQPIEWNDVPYDVQLIGGIVLHQGRIAEMATGEGKTLVAILPLYLNALEARGSHLATFNDFLARRDAEWTGHILEWLGITVGCIQQDQDPPVRRDQYAADVTYGQSSEFGFDYLRDNMTHTSAALVQGARSRISQALAQEIVAFIGKDEGGKVITDQFDTLLVETHQKHAADLLNRFAARFTIDKIRVIWPGEKASALLPKLPPRAPEVEEEFGFPGIPEHMVRIRFQFIPRDHRYCIVDEADSMLIDEARTPLIISGPVDRSTHRYDKMQPLVDNLFRKQSGLVNQFLNEAESLLAEKNSDSTYQAGMKLLQVKKGMPTNKRLMKLLNEPEIAKLVNKCENDFIIDQKSKMGEKSMGWVEEDLYFIIEEKGHNVHLSEKGRTEVSPDNPERFLLADIVEEFAKIEAEPDLDPQEREKQKNLVRQQNETKSEELHNISQLLVAYALYEKDVKYVVQDNKVIIVDEFTGRLQPGRRYSDGLHQAIEAKEHVKIEKETQTLATITIQNYFRMYDKIAGMTGTAETEASEFAHTYKMDVVVIPTNRPVVREDFDDVIYRTRREKYNAIIEEITRLHNLGLPVLVGTVSVEVSELLSRMLKRTGVSHSVLNAKYHAKESEIVADAGKAGAVTIATNMAGRGTDIKLGLGVIKCKAGESHNGAYCPTCPFKPDGAKTDDELQPCGLQIIGTERHEARRIDRQLRGRAGRQGDPGSSRFFLSLEDDLMRLFGSERIAGMLQKIGLKEGDDIQHPLITSQIMRAQRRIEEINFEHRKRTLDYDNVMNKQRSAVYGLRREVLIGEDLREIVLDLCRDAIGGQIEKFRIEEQEFSAGPIFDFDAFESYVRSAITEVNLEGIERTADPDDQYIEQIMDRIAGAYDARREMFGPDFMRELARYVILGSIDPTWQDHLLAIDELREGIHMVSYAQLDPLVEYQKRASYLFQDMMTDIHRMVFERFFKFVPAVEEHRVTNVQYGRGSEAPAAAAAADEAGEPDGDGAMGEPRGAQPEAQPVHTYHRDQPKVGRNDPCPCGSGKKFKKCCGQNAA